MKLFFSLAFRSMIAAGWGGLYYRFFFSMRRGAVAVAALLCHGVFFYFDGFGAVNIRHDDSAEDEGGLFSCIKIAYLALV